MITVDFAGQKLSMRLDGLMTPARNRRLADSEYETACWLADRVAELKAAAPETIERLALDAAVANPANNWASLAATWHPLYGKSRRDIEHLRLYCQPFTGFDPIRGDIHGVSPESLPADLEGQLHAKNQNLTIHSTTLISDRRRLPEYARVRLPPVFGEVGLVIDGVLAGYDAWSLQTQMNGLFGSGALRYLRERAAAKGAVTIADIGSGFGGFGYQLGRALPAKGLRFVAVDLPDSLIFAAIYLAALWDDRPNYLAVPGGYLSVSTGELGPRLPEDFGAVFVANFLAERVLDELKPVDAMLNFRSMQEMSDAQIAHYAELARAVIGDEGLLYEQNGTSRTTDRDVKTILGNIFPEGGPLPETDPPHRGMAPASLWSNRPLPIRPQGASS
ncbi:MAG: hypothetical protein HYR63_25110 [Proteobacteria bacterium]|nr:hypothetical protein [Pseudomonadota bacterium]MBI3497209.1 hypothetical protein [Pseudomonadota bacterium]